MDHDESLAKILRTAGYDINRLSDAERVRVFDLARAARIELPHPGAVWPSGTGAGRTGGGITPNPTRRP